MDAQKARDAYRKAAGDALGRIDAQRDADRAGRAQQAAQSLAEKRAARLSRIGGVSRAALCAVPLTAAATASLYDVAHLTDITTGNPFIGAGVGLAIDLTGGFFLWQLWTDRAEPARAVGHYRRASSLLWFSAVLNGASGLLAAGASASGLLVAAGTALMPILAKLICLALILTGSLSGELMKGPGARQKLAGMGRDRQRAALSAYGLRHSLETERATELAELERLRMKADMQVQRERVALGMQSEMNALVDAAMTASDFAPPTPVGKPVLSVVKDAPVPEPGAPQALSAVPDLPQDASRTFGFTAVRGTELLTVSDVAAVRGVTAGTVRSWVNRGKLPVARKGDDGRSLFHPDDVAGLDS